MSAPQPPIPEVYVLWHPDCPIGEALARRIHGWLRPDNGLGPEVFYRSLPAPGAPARGLPLPLPGEARAAATQQTRSRRSSNLQVVLPLINADMVADPAWRYWLGELGKKSPTSGRRRIIPVALDPMAFNMPGAIQELNYLRPTGLPLPAPASDKSDAFEGVVRSLLKQLTEAMCKILLPRSAEAQPITDEMGVGASLPKVTVFLSHARKDGTKPAEQLRDYIYSQTQLGAFYDENDIALGSKFARVIERSLEADQTAALIAVRSAEYARRPWCRREVSLFRTPRREASPSERTLRYRLFPVLVVEAMESASMSPGIPELGNSPLIRWDEDTPGLDEKVVTTVLRDAMLGAFHAALGATLPPVTDRSTQLVLNWLPDAPSLLRIPEVRTTEELHVVYPGEGMPGPELDTLSEYFANVTFHSFEGASGNQASISATRGPRRGRLGRV